VWGSRGEKVAAAEAEAEVGAARIYETAIGSGASESVAALLPSLCKKIII
jgi:hypothetical protein